MVDIRDIIPHLEKCIERANLYSWRFGTFTKTDYEVLMFTAYMDAVGSGMVDYKISEDLGIPESKVRTLRIKSQLQYPKEVPWIEALATAIKHGLERDRMITITINDPVVRNRIFYEIESRMGVVNKTLNSKQIELPYESYILLAACAEKDMDAVIDEINKIVEKKEKIRKQDFGRKVLNTTTDVAGLLSSISSLFVPGAPIISALMHLFM